MESADQVIARRAREKQESREADRLALESGQKSRDELRAENGAFAPIACEARLAWSKARLS